MTCHNECSNEIIIISVHGIYCVDMFAFALCSLQDILYRCICGTQTGWIYCACVCVSAEMRLRARYVTFLILRID